MQSEWPLAADADVRGISGIDVTTRDGSIAQPSTIKRSILPCGDLSCADHSREPLSFLVQK